MSGDPRDLTEIERARNRALYAAQEELRDSALSGEAGSAAFAQFWQNLMAHPRPPIDALHVPDDAGEASDALRRILLRIPDGWGRWISCDRGWYPSVIELDNRLAMIDSTYQLRQVKEKFGRLCYYYKPSDGVSDADRNRMRAVVTDVTSQCQTICESCGAAGATRSVLGHGWIKTVCAACAAERGFEPLGEKIDDLTPRRWGLWTVSTESGPPMYWDLTRHKVHVDGNVFDCSEMTELPRVGSTCRIHSATAGQYQSDVVTQIERTR